MLEAELVMRARLGEEVAFTALYKLHFCTVQALARTILHRRDVEDVCQDIFLLAFTRLDRFEEKCSMRSWMTRIAINQCIAALQAERQVTNGDAHLVALEDELLALPRLDARLQGVAGRLDLSRLLRMLPPEERRLITMTHVDGLSLTELAELLGKPTEYVRQKLFRARRRMQRNK